MMEYKDLRDLTLAVARADASKPTAYSFGEKSYSYSDLQNTLRAELNELAGDFNSYRRNQIVLFQLMEEAIDEVLPKMVMDRYMDFADVKTFKQGSKAVFTQPVGRNRAKKNFVTRVGLAGIYEVFKLDKSVIEVQMTAVGGAAQVGLEEFLDGNVDFSEMFNIILEGMDEAIYAEVAKALEAMVANFNANNKVVTAGFNEAKFDQLIATAESYGPATIYCTFEFAATMIPSDARMSDTHKNELWSTGYIGNYKGHRVVVLPQSVTEDNAEKIVDPAWAYIFPGGTKPVKLAFEGQTVIDEFKNADRSRDIHAYKKFGVATFATNAMAAYKNTSLVKDNTIAG